MLPHLEGSGQTYNLTQSQPTDTEQTSCSTDPIVPGVAARIPIFKSLVRLDWESAIQISIRMSSALEADTFLLRPPWVGFENTVSYFKPRMSRQNVTAYISVRWLSGHM